MIGCHDFVLCFLVSVSMSLYRVVLCLLCFVFHALMCPLSSSVYFPMFFPLAPSVCCVPFMFSHVLLPFVTTPGLLPPLSSPVPHLFISVCIFGLCVTFTPCPVIVCPLNVPVCVASDPVPDSVLVMLLIKVSCLAFFRVSWYVLDFEFCILHFLI